MSSAYLIEFFDGKGTEETVFRNSWGGSARIWDTLYEEYIKDPNNPHDIWLMGNTQKLWDLPKDPEMPDFERAVNIFTFDKVIVRRKNFMKFAYHLDLFAGKYPVGDRVDHLKEWQKFFENSKAEAIGLHGTSVSENLWNLYDEDSDEHVYYNIDEQDEHFEVYEYLEELNSRVSED